MPAYYTELTTEIRWWVEFEATGRAAAEAKVEELTRDPSHFTQAIEEGRTYGPSTECYALWSKEEVKSRD